MEASIASDGLVVHRPSFLETRGPVNGSTRLLQPKPAICGGSHRGPRCLHKEKRTYLLRKRNYPVRNLRAFCLSLISLSSVFQLFSSAPMGPIPAKTRGIPKKLRRGKKALGKKALFELWRSCHHLSTVCLLGHRLLACRKVLRVPGGVARSIFSPESGSRCSCVLSWRALVANGPAARC